MRRYHDVADPRIVKMMAHPLRIKLLRYLEDHVASPTQLAKEFDVVVGTVSYHVRELHKLGLIEPVRQIPRRGAIEHFYRAPEHIWFSDESWAQLPRIVRTAFSEAALSVIASEVQAAITLGHLDTDDAWTSRTTVLLTKEDRASLNELALEFREKVLQLQERSARSLRANDRDPDDKRPTSIVTLIFEPAPEFRTPTHGLQSAATEASVSSASSVPRSPRPRPAHARGAGRRTRPGKR